MSKLSNDEDRARTKASRGSMGGTKVLKIIEGHTFILLLTEEYEEGFNHWVKIFLEGKKEPKIYKRTCPGGLEAKGWAPDECSLCELSMAQFDLKKAAKEASDSVLAEEYNDKGNDLRASYSAVFPAVKFATLSSRKEVKSAKGKTKTAKVYRPDYVDFQIGKVMLTHAQITKLIDLVEDDAYPQIEEGTDLAVFVLDFVKEKVGDKKFAELTKIIPSKKKSKFELEEEIPDLGDEFEIEDDLEKIVALYNGEEDTEGDEYEEEELEKDTGKKDGKKNQAKDEGEDDF
ncbi:hypothetical protein LCGC14_0616720 [marine sediment metagenome]|uniref:Uncharacterized protein n=1 Tax=marine sediment metagenome TaxID=412755 RepID=A0A0F9R618_9ZZZZ